MELKIGDKIKLDLGERKTLEGEELSGHNPYVETEDEGEKIVNTKSYEFTIVRNNCKTKLFI